MTDNHGELILYRTDDGRTDVHLRAEGGTVWLTQGEMAELFDTTKQNISLHVRNVFADQELSEEAVVKQYLTTASDGKRYKTMSYRLDLILAIGFRVRSPRGVQFRRWAGSALAEYLVKGFLLNDERLKDAERADYFKELLRRIRDIRSSEKRFYQTLRDLFKLSSSDYDAFRTSRWKRSSPSATKRSMRRAVHRRSLPRIRTPSSTCNCCRPKQSA